MNIGKRSILPFLSLIALISVSLLFLTPPSASGHGDNFIKPKPLPLAQRQRQSPTRNPGSPGSPGTPGSTVTPSTVPNGSATGSKTKTGGSFTKKTGAARSTLTTWEEWWVRNRYTYLRFPNIYDESGLYPVTPGSERDMAAFEDRRKRSIALYRTCVDHDVARLRRIALLGLARLNDEESFDRILEALHDTNQTVRDSAVLALGLMKKAEAKHHLLHIARGSDSARRLLGQSEVPDYLQGFAEVSLALSETKGIKLVLRNLALDKSASPEVKAMALESLGILGGPEEAKFLMDFAEYQKAPQPLLAAAVTALGKTSDPVAIPFLAKTISGNTMGMRQSAVIGLGNLARKGDEALVKKLYLISRNTADQGLKGLCLIALGQIGGYQAIQYLDHAVAKGPSSIRPWACIALGLACMDIPDEEATKHLLAAVQKSSSNSARGAAAIALGLMREKRAVDVLGQIIEKENNPELRGYCALALGMIGQPNGLDPLREVLVSNEQSTTKLQAVLALALMHDRSSIPSLVELLITSKNDQIKSFVGLSLCYMGDVTIVDTLLRRIEKEGVDDLTLLHCIYLTSKLLAGQNAPYLRRVAEGSNFACEYPLVQYLLAFGL